MWRIEGFRIYTETNSFGYKRVTVYVDYVPVVQFDPENLDEQKLAAIELVERHNCSQTVAGKICGLHRNTVFKALRIKRILGIEAIFKDNRGPNGPSKYVGDLRAHIKKLLRKHPQWTDQQIADQAASDFSTKVPRSSIARIRTEKEDKNRKNPSKAQLVKMAKEADEIDRQRFDTRQLELNFTHDEDIKTKSEESLQEPPAKPTNISDERLVDRLVKGERFNFSGALMHYLFLSEIGFSNIVSQFNNVPFTTYGVGDILGVVFLSTLWEYHQLKR